MIRRAHFKVEGGPFYKTQLRTARLSVIGDQVVVRPSRCRRVFQLPLDTVAKMVVDRVVKAEVFKDKMERAKLRKLGRAARRGRS